MKRKLKIELKLKKSINKRFHVIEQAYQNYYNNPYSSTYVHRLRVELRKLRAILSFLKPLLNLTIYDELSHDLKLLGVMLSRKRDLDTMIEWLELTADKEPRLILNYAEVFRHFEKLRLDEANNLNDVENIQLFQKTIKKIGQTINDLKFDLSQMKKQSLEAYVLHRLKQKERRLTKKYKRLDLNDYESIHEIRKDAKKVRYATVGMKNFIPQKVYRKMKIKAKTIQEDLGTRTDYFVMIDLIKEFQKEVVSDELNESLQKLIHYQLQKHTRD